MHNAPRNDLRGAIGAAAAVALVTGLYTWAHVANPTTIALTYLLVVLIIAAVSSLGVAIATSAVSGILLNFFFMPPVGRFTIADPANLIALLVSLTVSLVASNLSSVAGARAGEAVQRRDEMSRLFDLSRDVLLTTDSREAIQQLARFVARRFDLDYVAIAFPRGGEWQIVESGSPPIALDADQLTLAAGVAERTLEFDARERTYAGHRTIETGDGAIRIVPLRLGVKPIGALAAAGRPIEPGSLDALGGVVASAIERVQLLEERKAAE